MAASNLIDWHISFLGGWCSDNDHLSIGLILFLQKRNELGVLVDHGWAASTATHARFSNFNLLFAMRTFSARRISILHVCSFSEDKAKSSSNT